MKKVKLLILLFLAFYCTSSKANYVMKGDYWSDDITGLWGCNASTNGCVVVVTPSSIVPDQNNPNNYYIEPQQGYNSLDVYLYNLQSQTEYTEVFYSSMYVANDGNGNYTIQGND